MPNSNLLLLHGTIYGTANIAAAPVPYAGITDSIGRHDAWAGPEGLYYEVTMPGSPISGAHTDNAPIDVVHWAADGAAPHNAAAVWQQCIMLLSRV